MTYYESPEQLAANPPSTWRVIKRGTRWGLYIEAGAEHPIRSFDTKREALAQRDDPTSRIHREIEADRQWYAGVTPIGWKSYAECLAERQRNDAYQAARRAAREAVTA